MNEVHTEISLTLTLLKELRQMALDLSALTAAITKVSADVDTLITANANATATDQAAVNALIPQVQAISTKAEAAVAPAPAAPAA